MGLPASYRPAETDAQHGEMRRTINSALFILWGTSHSTDPAAAWRGDPLDQHSLRAASLFTAILDAVKHAIVHPLDRMSSQLFVTGASGSGKTRISWELHAQLNCDGPQCAYVHIDGAVDSLGAGNAYDCRQALTRLIVQRLTAWTGPVAQNVTLNWKRHVHPPRLGSSRCFCCMSTSASI